MVNKKKKEWLLIVLVSASGFFEELIHFVDQKKMAEGLMEFWRK